MSEDEKLTQNRRPLPLRLIRRVWRHFEEFGKE